MRLKGMHKLSIIAALVVLSTQCLAQGGPNGGQCEQVRAAVVQYGLQAARRNAMQNYGLAPADLRRIEQECGVGNRGPRIIRVHRRGRHQA
jgi:hypothetical protein